MSTRELIRQQLEEAAIKSGDALRAARIELGTITNQAARNVQQLKIQQLAVEHDRCLSAIFRNPDAQ